MPFESALLSWLREQAGLSEPVLSKTVSTLEANDAVQLNDLRLLRELPVWSNIFPPLTAHKISAALDNVASRTQGRTTPAVNTSPPASPLKLDELKGEPAASRSSRGGHSVGGHLRQYLRPPASICDHPVLVTQLSRSSCTLGLTF